MKKYKIKRIEEPDFGCEGRPEGQPVMDKVYLEDEKGNEMIIEAADEFLYQINLDEGDMAFYSDKEGLKKA